MSEIHDQTSPGESAGNAAQTIEFPPGFPEEQKRALQALAAGAGVVAAARAAGVHHSTVSRWINQGGESHDQEIPAAMAIVRSMKLLNRLGTVETAGTSADA